MTTVEAMHELRRMAQPTCWRCEGKGRVRMFRQDHRGGTITSRDQRCPSCAGTGAPERVA